MCEQERASRKYINASYILFAQKYQRYRLDAWIMSGVYLAASNVDLVFNLHGLCSIN